LEFASDELGHLFAITDIVLSRSGANALYELLTLTKPHVLIPLSKQASRGDQIQNASYFAKQGISTVIMEEDLEAEQLISSIHDVYARKNELSKKMEDLGFCSATEKVKEVILSTMG
jgi:UDP-N-acetylglucosamine--N-acetylmuramyl-(pentapeptide) pyrophosphoryl-undecaprenol N-acetylglucosamine transferase